MLGAHAVEFWRVLASIGHYARFDWHAEICQRLAKLRHGGAAVGADFAVGVLCDVFRTGAAVAEDEARVLVVHVFSDHEPAAHVVRWTKFTSADGRHGGTSKENSSGTVSPGLSNSISDFPALPIAQSLRCPAGPYSRALKLTHRASSGFVRPGFHCRAW